MLNRILQLSAAASSIAVLPHVVSAQSVAYGTPPVGISACSLSQSFVPRTNIVGGEEAPSPQFISSDMGLNLNFVIKANKPATTVTFLLSDGKYTQSIVDKGTFSPGVPIKHSFALDGPVSVLPNAACNVSEVDFSDGSAWRFGGDVVGDR